MENLVNMFNLKDKIAMVTGSRRGIGQSLALGMAHAGAKVISLDRNSPDKTRSDILRIGGDHVWKRVDLQTATSELLDIIIEEIWNEYGRLDILINNAGICPRQPALSFPESDWEKTLKINLTAVWLLSQKVAGKMVSQGWGKIINMASMLSFQGGINVPAYAASKHGILAVTRSLANELAGKGINVNAIAPGYIQTDLTSELSNDEHRNKEVTDRIPAGRWGRADEIQGACIYLASSASDYVHGACIPVDGGWLSR